MRDCEVDTSQNREMHRANIILEQKGMIVSNPQLISTHQCRGDIEVWKLAKFLQSKEEKPDDIGPQNILILILLSQSQLNLVIVVLLSSHSCLTAVVHCTRRQLTSFFYRQLLPSVARTVLRRA